MTNIVGPPHPVRRTVDRCEVVHDSIQRGVALKRSQERDPKIVQEQTKHLDVCLQHTDKNHRQHTGIDEFHRETPTGTTYRRMCKRDLNPCRFYIDNHKEYRNGGNQSEHVSAEVLQERCTIHDDRKESREEPDRICVLHSIPVQEPVDKTLGNTSNDKETDAGADPPFCNNLIHKEDQYPTDTDLQEDKERHSTEVSAK